MDIKKHIILIFFAFTCLAPSFGQASKIKQALDLFKQSKLDSAGLIIDQAIENEETKEKSSTYYYAGIIYKEKYNKQQKDDKASPARDKAIEYFNTFLKLNEDEKLVPPIKKSIDYLINTIYNDAVVLLNTETYDQSITLFEKYKKLQAYADPTKDINKINIQYNLVLGQVYSDLYDKNEENKTEFFEKTANTYLKVLQDDPENWGANYNLGIHYYNEAVNRIKALEYDVDLVTLDMLEGEYIGLFKMALPYMQKAYQMNPNRKETIIGLSGIYYSLKDYDRSDEYTEKLKKLEEEK